MIDPTEPAFPTDSRESRTLSGLSKREYFAAMALSGLVNATENGSIGLGDSQQMAEVSVGLADALIAELNKA